MSHLVGRGVPAMVRAEWESAGVAGLHLLPLEGRLALHAGKQLTPHLKNKTVTLMHHHIFIFQKE